MSERRTVGSAIVELLAGHGVEVVFGIPGVQTLELFRGIHATEVRLVLARNEVGAVFAADGYARVTGRPGVALLISGPGLTNAATAVAQARHDSVPLLVVSAAPPRATAGRGWGSLHEMPDQLGFMATLARSARHVEDPEELPDALGDAFDLFAAARPGPVHVQVPADVLTSDCGPLTPRPGRASPPAPDVEAVRAAAALLRGAERPMVLAGGGAAGAGGALARLAEAAGAPVALTLNGKGALPDRHPLSVSTTLPSPATLEALQTADVMLAVGTEFSEVDYYYAGAPLVLDGELVRVDIDAGQLDARFPAAVGVLGDAAAALDALATELGPSPRGTAEALRRAEAIRAARTWWERARPLLGLVEALDAALPEDAVVACDSTQLAYIGQNAWTAQRPRSWLVPTAWGTLGCALPMAAGAAVGAAGRPAIAVAGDGGLLFTVGEMAMGAELGRGLVLLLWNNDGYQEMKDEFAEAGIRPAGVDAAARDYLAIARGFGWAAERVESRDAVGDALAAAIGSAGPALLELTPALL